MQEFNFDWFIEAKADKIKAKPPDFTNLQQLFTTEALERRHSGRVFMDLSTNKVVELPRKKELYYCSCWQYNVGGAKCNCQLPCTAILQRGEQIYTVSIWTNRNRGTTRTERWRRECWETNRPIMEHEWMESKWLRDQDEANLAFSLIQDVKETHRRGKPSVSEQFNLTETEAAQRTLLVRKYTTYRYRRVRALKAIQLRLASDGVESVIRASARLSHLEELMNEVYTSVTNLGGVPEGWEYYESTTTS
tara:strand:- start:951 stop:1697 length:747 start_codon:yes stop_codon:yes gene_type:complete